MSRSILFTLAALASVSASASSPLLLPGGPATLPSGSAEETRKSLVAVGKSLAEDSSTDVWIVQYDPEKTMASAIRRLVAAAGAKILSPVSGGAYLVRATKAQQLAILESGQIEATRPYVPEDKGAPAAPEPGAKALLGGPDAPDGTVYVVAAFSDADPDSLGRRISALEGCEVLSGDSGVLRVRMTASGRATVAALPEVEAVGEWAEPAVDNDLAVKAMRVHTIWPSRQGQEVAAEAVSRNRGAAPVRRPVVEDLFTKGLLTPTGEDASPTPDAESSADRFPSAPLERADRFQAAESLAADSVGLTGKGQVVTVLDTGLDTGNEARLHPDVRGRVVGHYSYGRPAGNDLNGRLNGRWDDPDGHGTHVMGSVLGSGAASNGKIRGAAYEADLVVQSSYAGPEELKCDAATALVEAYTFRTADGRVSRIHSDSWGAASRKFGGMYNDNSMIFDAVSFVGPDFLLVKSAGNHGRDAEAPSGVVDPGSITPPATSKNALTVGAAESFRTEGGLSKFVWGAGGLKSDFPNDPIASDFISRPKSGARGMAAFSSRGPCRDGRVKPDVVAPGTDILSVRTRGARNPEGWGDFDDNYFFMGGTSMACPLVAGTAALVRQWLVERKGVPDPDAATMKALICAGAKSLAPGQYGTGEFQEIPFSYPNNVEGWGMVDLENTVANPDGVAFRDGEVVAEGETATFRVVVPGGRPLCILMAYSDAPATSFSGGLVNDLDMTIVDPSGKTWYPNSKNGPDRENNVEGVRWANAPAGEYAVSIRARSVQKPMNAQLTRGRDNATRFSLVANGAREIR